MQRAHLQLLLVRHADPVRPGTPGYGDGDRPLTALGFAQSEELALALDGEPVRAIYSSPYLRARQTIEAFARRRNLPIKTSGDLRERMLAPGVRDNWREELRRSFEDFDYAPPGAETNRAAQARVLRVLDAIRSRHRDGSVVLVSHGNLLTLALAAFEPAIGFDFWLKLPTPAIYRLAADSERWEIISGPHLPAPNSGAR